MEKKFNSLKSQIRDVNFGKDCTVIEPSNLYECELGDNVFVGPFVEITKGVKIGDRTLEFRVIAFICESS
jgi:bifunctional N-acetylglucosamine-1-phosphate-uridyltransferase/glucosamine-1-phosphate-acetyltransferase GlmU-like protein